jgi:hypothetical protein
MCTQGRIRTFLLAVVLAVAFSLSFGLTPGLAEDCPCFGGVDNFCFYSPSTSGCSMTYPGGYCDPNGDGDYSEGDWVRGYFEYQEACPDGGPPPPPPLHPVMMTMMITAVIIPPGYTESTGTVTIMPAAM